MITNIIVNKDRDILQQRNIKSINDLKYYSEQRSLNITTKKY